MFKNNYNSEFSLKVCDLIINNFKSLMKSSPTYETYLENVKKSSANEITALFLQNKDSEIDYKNILDKAHLFIKQILDTIYYDCENDFEADYTNNISKNCLIIENQDIFVFSMLDSLNILGLLSDYLNSIKNTNTFKQMEKDLIDFDYYKTFIDEE